MITSSKTRLVYTALLQLRRATLADLADLVGDKQGRVLGHLRRLRRLGLVTLDGAKRGGIWSLREDAP